MKDRKYSKDHEWVFIENNIATVGITDHAQESLGDIVFVELPEIGKDVSSGNEVSVIESVKAASDIFTPIDGKIIETNNKLNDDASIINKDPENEGWIFKIEISNSKNLDDLMSLEQYNEFLKQNK
tara:strand:+ start:121 stop:498 length:378 start_codon:yes stop_codon:yes gene_type:complete